MCADRLTCERPILCEQRARQCDPSPTSDVMAAQWFWQIDHLMDRGQAYSGRRATRRSNEFACAVLRASFAISK